MSQLVIEIESSEVEVRRYNERESYLQKATAFCAQKKVFPINVKVDSPHAGYPAGRYHLDGDSFKMGQYGLELERTLKLVPVAKSA